MSGPVNGEQTDGIDCITQTFANGYSFKALTLNVATRGRVIGANGVNISQIGKGYLNGYAAIDNSGDITGSSCIALLATSGSIGFSLIANRAGGTIRAIVGSVGSLDSAGTIAVAHAYNAVNAATSPTITSGSTLAAPQVRFGSGDQRFTIAGGFAGAVDGGSGTDTLAVSDSSAITPVAFTNVRGVEAFALSGSDATVSSSAVFGSAVFGSATLSGGRLVGLAGWAMTGQFAVQGGAAFGLAGTFTAMLPSSEH